MEIRWIPIIEQTPPVFGNKSDIVDIKLKNNTIFEGYVNSKKEWFVVREIGDDWLADNVTHWKPTAWRVE